MQIEAVARILFFGFTSGLGLALGMELGKGRVAKGGNGKGSVYLRLHVNDIMKMKLV